MSHTAHSGCVPACGQHHSPQCGSSGSNVTYRSSTGVSHPWASRSVFPPRTTSPPQNFCSDPSSQTGTCSTIGAIPFTCQSVIMFCLISAWNRWPVHLPANINDSDSSNAAWLNITKTKITCEMLTTGCLRYCGILCSPPSLLCVAIYLLLNYQPRSLSHLHLAICKLWSGDER